MRKLVLLVVLALLIFTLSVGVVAFANDDTGETGTEDAKAHGAGAPVGSNISDPGYENGFGNPKKCLLGNHQ